MTRALILALAFFFSPFASAEKWPTVKDLEVGETFKFPILGVPGGTQVRPTQRAVGFIAVELKAKTLGKLGHDDLKRKLERDPIPVVAAPDGHFYMIDHHHQAVAAHQIGRENAFYILHHDASKLADMDTFWAFMEKKEWVRAFDEFGRPIKVPQDLPTSILKLKDDIYRSLSWFVRRAGGYKKTAVEFAEFTWADFFRTRIKLGSTKRKFFAAVKDAEDLAHTSEANGLPGWSSKRVECLSWLEIEEVVKKGL